MQTLTYTSTAGYTITMVAEDDDDYEDEDDDCWDEEEDEDEDEDDYEDEDEDDEYEGDSVESLVAYIRDAANCWSPCFNQQDLFNVPLDDGLLVSSYEEARRLLNEKYPTGIANTTRIYTNDDDRWGGAQNKRRLFVAPIAIFCGSTVDHVKEVGEQTGAVAFWTNHSDQILIQSRNQVSSAFNSWDRDKDGRKCLEHGFLGADELPDLWQKPQEFFTQVEEVDSATLIHFQNQVRLTVYKYDPEKAAQLLKKSAARVKKRKAAEERREKERKNPKKRKTVPMQVRDLIRLAGSISEIFLAISGVRWRDADRVSGKSAIINIAFMVDHINKKLGRNAHRKLPKFAAFAEAWRRTRKITKEYMTNYLSKNEMAWLDRECRAKPSDVWSLEQIRRFTDALNAQPRGINLFTKPILRIPSMRAVKAQQAKEEAERKRNAANARRRMQRRAKKAKEAAK